MKSEDMSHRLLIFSSDLKLRKAARVKKVEDFLELARQVPANNSRTIEMLLFSHSLHVHDLDEIRLVELLTFLSIKLDPSDFTQWVSDRYDLALKDHALQAIQTIHSVTGIHLVFDPSEYRGDITPELIDFLEENKHLATVSPFAQVYSWRQTTAGIEGFVRLIKLVNHKNLVNFFITGHEDYPAYIPLSLLSEEGALDGYFDQDIINILNARGLIAGLNNATTDDMAEMILKRHEPTQVLMLLAAEAKRPICGSELTKALAKVHRWAHGKHFA